MAFHLFLFLLVVCLLLSLALLWRLCWLHLEPSNSKAGSRRAPLHRLLKPRTPLDCPLCRISSSGMRPVPAPVRPWGEVKSRRGAPKRVNTEGFACPNQQCPYFGITDAHIHALVGDGKHGQAEHIQTFRCQACHITFSARRHTPLYRLKTPSQQVAMVLAALAEGMDASAAERVFGYRQPPSPRGSLAQAGTLKSSMSDPSTTCTFRICSWTNYAPGCAVPNRFSGCGWPSIPSPRFCLCLSLAPARKPWRMYSSTPSDRTWPLAASRFSPAMG